MKLFYFLLLVIPTGSLIAQAKPIVKPKAGLQAPGVKQRQVASNTKTAKSQAPVRDNYVINGVVAGFSDGTPVSVLNGQTGVSEAEATVQKGKFTLQGKLPMPDFKLIAFNHQPPYITVLLDNSLTKLIAEKDSLQKAILTGSRTNDDFSLFNRLLEPYNNVFDPNAPFDSADVHDALLLSSEFVIQRPKSYVSPIAIIRYNQLTQDPVKTEQLYNLLDTTIKQTPAGVYIVSLLKDQKKNPIGSVFPDFIQNDTAGVPVSLSSLRGKYVLIDFWASWCGPCRQENPNVLNAYNKFKNKNFTILGVSLDKSKEAWEKAITMDNLTWNHVSDLQGWGNAVALKNEIYRIPQNILIDPEGKIVAKNLRGEALERSLQRFIK